MFVNLLVMSMCCAKTVELIEMLFGMWTRERRLGLGNHYYVRPPDRWGHRRRKGSVVGGTMASAEHKPITSGLGAEPTTTNLSYRKQYALLRSMHCHWCQSWGAQSAWCPQPRHWGPVPPAPRLRRLCIPEAAIYKSANACLQSERSYYMCTAMLTWLTTINWRHESPKRNIYALNSPLHQTSKAPTSSDPRSSVFIHSPCG